MVRSKPALRETVPEVGRVRFRYVFLAATAGALAAFSVPSSALLPSMSHPSVMRSTTFVKAGRRAGALSGWGIGARSGPAVGWQQRRRRRAEEVSVAEDMITTTSVSTEKGVATETGMGLNGQEESGVRQEEGLGSGSGSGSGSGPGELALERVKNIRDLSSVVGSGIQPGRVYRTGFVSEATEADSVRLREEMQIRTLVDLRSQTETTHDERLHAEVYEGFVDVGLDPKAEGARPRLGAGMGSLWKPTRSEQHRRAEKGVGGGVKEGDGEAARKRFFVSLMDEGIYKKGVFHRLRKRHKAAVVALAPAMPLSRRCTNKAKGIFLAKINDGGLVLFNELLLQYSGEGINQVLRLLASRDRHPVAIYCTAGKDRTGLVMALSLACLGVSDEAILDDYVLSDSAYQELGDKDAMVGALAQRDIDPDTFLCAPRFVMEETLACVRRKHGSVEGYLDSIGFDESWRQRLRESLLGED